MTRLIGELHDGPLDIIGDLHGELDVLHALLGHLGYDAAGHHPEGRHLVFVGDLVDRGPDSPGVVELVRSFLQAGVAQCVLGNHELNLLRRDRKEGNAWYLDPDDEHERTTFGSQPAPANHGYHELFLSLPLALEHAELRIVHAAWHAPSIERLRTFPGTALELFDRAEAETKAALARDGIDAEAQREKQQYAAALVDRTASIPLLRNLGLADEYKQTWNPVRVLTSGPERLAAEPFFATGKWRMCERVLWWDEYTDPTPVIVGHYWRAADHDHAGDRALSGHKPDLFKDAAPHHWVGARRNVFCVDFSIGARHRERAKKHTTFASRLAAVRWPEQLLMFDDGTTRRMM